MQKQKTLSDFLKATHIHAALVRAVVQQLGGWQEFQDRAEDVAKHGAAGGFAGFTYYSDTVAFAKKHRLKILAIVQDHAEQHGAEGVCSFVASWPSLGLTLREVESVLIFNKDEDGQAMVYNALAWFALEEVACSFVDWKESEED